MEEINVNMLDNVPLWDSATLEFSTIFFNFLSFMINWEEKKDRLGEDFNFFSYIKVLFQLIYCFYAEEFNFLLPLPWAVALHFTQSLSPCLFEVIIMYCTLLDAGSDIFLTFYIDEQHYKFDRRINRENKIIKNFLAFFWHINRLSRMAINLSRTCLWYFDSLGMISLENKRLKDDNGDESRWAIKLLSETWLNEAYKKMF